MMTTEGWRHKRGSNPRSPAPRDTTARTYWLGSPRRDTVAAMAVHISSGLRGMVSSRHWAECLQRPRPRREIRGQIPRSEPPPPAQSVHPHTRPYYLRVKGEVLTTSNSCVVTLKSSDEFSASV